VGRMAKIILALLSKSPYGSSHGLHLFGHSQIPIQRIFPKNHVTVLELALRLNCPVL
jgi:hypothetical protein